MAGQETHSSTCVFGAARTFSPGAGPILSCSPGAEHNQRMQLSAAADSVILALAYCAAATDAQDVRQLPWDGIYHLITIMVQR